MGEPFRVVVCGGRDYSDLCAIYTTLTALWREHGALVVIQGGATGADSLARAWAAENAVECITEAADWKTHGKAAGPLRNQSMLTKHKPDAVLAFPGGRGTTDMVKRARGAGVRIIEGNTPPHSSIPLSVSGGGEGT